MAAPEISTRRSLSFSALPAEIHLAILPHLEFFDHFSLRLVNHYFKALIPPPTHAELLLAEKTDDNLYFLGLACVGCTRLRRIPEFSSKMRKAKKALGGTDAENRFCLECGRRPLPGIHRYTLGSRWDENGVPFARCLRCSTIDRGPEDQSVSLCLSCHRQDLERIRAAEELKRVQREAMMREERRSLREERRRNWVQCGRALSEFSSEDSDEQDDGDDLWWESGLDDGMNYSNYS